MDILKRMKDVVEGDLSDHDKEEYAMLAMAGSMAGGGAGMDNCLQICMLVILFRCLTCKDRLLVKKSSV